MSKVAWEQVFFPVPQFSHQDLSTIAPYAFIIYCQQYIILAIDSIIKKRKVKPVLMGIFQEIECREWGSCNILVNVMCTT